MQRLNKALQVTSGQIRVYLVNHLKLYVVVLAGNDLVHLLLQCSVCKQQVQASSDTEGAACSAGAV